MSATVCTRGTIVSMPGLTVTDDPFAGLSWYALVTHPGRQQYAVEGLERQGYRAYLPMCQRERVNRGKTELITRPLFDRYGFVGVEAGQPFGPIGNTRGVAFVVRRSDGRPCVVPAPALRHVKARCDADGGVLNLAPRPRVSQAPAWAEGQALRVLSGPFAEFVAVFQGASGDQARVLIELFGREMRLAIGVEQLVAVDAD